jgi:hypothetical protein
MWILCRRMGIVPGGDHVGRIVISAVAAWLVAWGLEQAGAPTVAWLAAGGVAYAALVVALGALRLDELRALTRRGEA